MQTVAVIDYGMGNLHSVAKALEHVGAGKVLITSDANVIREADRVVFPGVGAIRDCMAEIRRLGFDSLVREVSPRAALGFGGVAWQFDAVDGEHFPADQTLPVAQVEYLCKELGDFFIEAGDEGCQRGVVRGAIAG